MICNSISRPHTWFFCSFPGTDRIFSKLSRVLANWQLSAKAVPLPESVEFPWILKRRPAEVIEMGVHSADCTDW